MSGATGVIAGAAVAGTVGSAVAGSKAAKGQKQALAQQKEAADRQADIADRQQEMAEEQWARYKEKFQPIEDAYIEELRGIGSIANQNKSATQARAEVAGAYSRARDQLNRTPGANPTSATYLQEANRLNLAEAANSAAAQTGARQTQVDKGRAGMSDIINLGKGLPSTAASGLAGSAATNGSAARTAGSVYSNFGNQAASNSNSLLGFTNAVGGLANNPQVASGVSSLWNWATGVPTVQAAPITVTPATSGQVLVSP